jgi:hypothetical protein
MISVDKNLLEKAAKRQEGELVPGTTMTVTTGSEHCFHCANKAAKLFTDHFVCIGKENNGVYIPIITSIYYTCPEWAKIEREE